MLPLFWYLKTMPTNPKYQLYPFSINPVLWCSFVLTFWTNVSNLILLPWKRAVYLNFPNLSDSLEIQGIVKEHGKKLWPHSGAMDFFFNASIPSFSIVFGHRANNPSGCFKERPFLYLKNSSLTFLFQLETVISKAAALP